MSTSIAHAHHLYGANPKDYWTCPKPTKLARIQKREFTRPLTRGTLLRDYLPLDLPAAPTITGPIPLALPRYPNVLARTAEGGLVFMRPVHIVYRLPLRGC